MVDKWVGWQEKGDECCLKGDSGGQSTGIGKGCIHGAAGSNGKCCNKDGDRRTPCANDECQHCGISPSYNKCGISVNDINNKCYLSSYKRHNGDPNSVPSGDYYWPTISSDSTKVHLLARIFLGSVCLIWSGLSQLGFLTGGSGNDRWSKEGKLHEETKGLGSFMAAMGYDLDRLNQGAPDKGGEFVQTLLTNTVGWKDLSNGTNSKSVAEYYSSIYEKAKEAAKSTTESICKEYPLLVLHILASGYFRAGSAGAKGITPPAKPATSTDGASDAKKDTTSPRKPRTIREILYWLSALPYSQGYRDLVERMGDKTDQVTQGNSEDKKGQIELYDTSAAKASTSLKRNDITHYLMAACGYCPLVLIGIQGTIEKEVDKAQPAQAQGSAPAAPVAEKKCPKHKEDRNHRCDPKNIKEPAAQAAGSSAAPAPGGQQLKEGEVCYGGYHLEAKDFGPLHGMYANGLFGFQMDGSPAQCLDQLRVYVYHCFYQLYFLRKQCKVGVESGAVLGWKSCRYGSGLDGAGKENWICQKSTGTSNGKCNCHSSTKSPLMLFLCDSVEHMHCGLTKGKGVNDYPEIDDHIEAKDTIQPPHFGKPPKHCPVPMGWQSESTGSSTSGGQIRENHFKDLTKGTHKQSPLDPPLAGKYPVHCTGNTLSYLLEYYCDPDKCSSGTLVVLLRLLACITPTVPRTLGDLFGFYYYIVYIGGNQGGGGGKKEVYTKLGDLEKEVLLHMGKDNKVVEALTTWSGGGSGCTSGCKDTLRCLYGDKGTGQCSHYLSPLSGQQYGQLSPLMAGTYLSWLVYLIEGFHDGLEGLAKDYRNIVCKDEGCGTSVGGGAGGCSGDTCKAGSHGTTCSGGGNTGVCQCPSVVSCTGVLPGYYRCCTSMALGMVT
ncbi:variant erythrocyte surface antigen-1 beta subunit [Babesia bovis T2Bo]|uniref:variant erythrocyte surface antigen-1 beta subunit n=1 Tax=Babesia bovis T2Bo TaxID=484906 RepID=UPI001C356700|nr:variant erythrocyte surface antigen-1 beta subunit [Babesia bovis T2Bo]EDO06632.2 variant erythrocyte surface antigen-1 beta subunit [Babesia bovis T2Bo]